MVPFDRALLYVAENDVLRTIALEGRELSGHSHGAHKEVNPRGTAAGWAFEHRQPRLSRGARGDGLASQRGRRCGQALRHEADHLRSPDEKARNYAPEVTRPSLTSVTCRLHRGLLPRYSVMGLLLKK